jgi:hypothetical protein
MAFITAGIALVSAAFTGITVASVASFAVRTMVTIGISKLVANRANKKGAGAQDVGSRFSLGPATNNKLPVSYGSAFLGTVMTDAKITTDQKTMYYVYSVCEATSGTMSFGKIFWNGKEVTLGAGDYGANNKVVSLTTNATTPQVDDTINGYAWIYQFSNGSSSGINTGGTSAITILQDAGIPVGDRWTSTDLMSDTCFIIVKVIYNQDVQDVRTDPKLSVQVTNTLTKPGEVLYDYMTDVQYGCAIDPANIDGLSLIALDVYSDQTITYVPVGGGSATQPRYRIDGPVNTGDNCLSNLQQLVDACDSWLQYSELTGQWTIVMNKPYSGVIGDLYSVDSSVLIGGIDINPIDLNQTYNSLEVQYPNSNINDQTDYKVVDLTTVGTAWYDPSLLSPNEPNNRLVVQYPQINNYIRAVYLGVRRLLQSREDLTIVCNLDYSGIQVVAGDVVRVTLAEYGWTDKLFRVSQVQETKTSDGFLGARITAFEYNGTIYADNALEDFIPEANTGLSDPNIFDRPGTPIITTNSLANSGAVTSFTVSSTVPASGTTLYMDFNYGNTSNVSSHRSYTSTQLADGSLYTNGQTVSIDINDLPVGNYYFSTTARNELAGRASLSSSLFNWGANLQANSVTFTTIDSNLNKSLRLGQSFFFVPFPSTNTVILPVDITTPDFNVPTYIDGTTVSPTKYYPYYQGTSSTTDGYLANSTASLQPAVASIISITNGYDDWWILLYTEPSPTFQSGWLVASNLEASFVSDNDTAIQVMPFFTSVSDPSTIVGYTYQMSSHILSANLPYRIVTTTTFPVGPTMLGMGYLIRNMISGTRVTAVLGTHTIDRTS